MSRAKGVIGENSPRPQLCIICLSSKILSSEISWLQFLIPEETPTLASNLCSIFLLRKLLKVPGEKCEEWMKNTFGIDPGNWCSLCESCSKHIIKAYMLNQKVLSLERQIQLIRNKLENKLESSFCVKDLEEEVVFGEEDTFKVNNVHRMIREYFYEVIEERRKSEEATSIRLPRTCAVQPLIFQQDKLLYDEDEVSYCNSPLSQLNDDDNDRDPLYIPDTSEIVERRQKITRRQLKPRQRRTKHSDGSNAILKFEERVLTDEAETATTINIAESCAVESSYECDKCESRFKYTSCLEVHKNIKHFGNTTPCPFCETMLKISVNLDVHWKKYCAHYPDRTLGKGNATTKRKPVKTQRKATKNNDTGTTEMDEQGSQPSEPLQRKLTLCPPPIKKTIKKRWKATAKRKPVEIQCKPIKNNDTTEMDEQGSKPLQGELSLCPPPTKKAIKKRAKPTTKRIIEFGEYRCEKCNLLCSTKLKLIKHMKVHQINDNFEPDLDGKVKCKLCGKCICGKGSTLFFHMRKFHVAEMGVMAFQCHLCNMGFKDVNTLNGHLRKHEKPKPFKCDICGAERTTENELIRHRRKNHSIGLIPSVCEFCGATFIRPQALYRHLRTFHPEQVPPLPSDKSRKARKPVRRDLKCKLCEKTVLHYKLMMHHLKTEHSEVYKYKCEYCDSPYREQRLLNAHIGAKHSTTKHSCPYCNVKLSYAPNMSYHWKNHCKEYQRVHGESNSSTDAPMQTE